MLVNDDPLKQGRLKLYIPGFNDGISADKIPWAEQRQPTLPNQFVLPLIDAPISVLILHDNTIQWQHLDFKHKTLTALLDDEYLFAHVLLYRNLAEIGDTGDLAIYYTPAQGLKLIKDKAFINFQKDSNILISNAKKTIHIKDGTISLGTENKSKESATLGEQNIDALTKLNNAIDNLYAKLSTYLNTLHAVAAANPYTLPLAAPITTAIATLQAQNNIDSLKISTQIPKTASSIVNLD